MAICTGRAVAEDVSLIWLPKAALGRAARLVLVIADIGWVIWFSVTYGAFPLRVLTGFPDGLVGDNWRL